jgi:hypothetical protein
MPTVTNVLNTNNASFTDYDVSKFLLGFNSFVDATFTAGGADVTLAQGTVMGRIAATGKIIALDKDATDGSQLPVGCIVEGVTIAANASKTLRLVNKGKIDVNKVVFADGTLDGTVGPTGFLRAYRDLLADLGLELVNGEELTKVDNS